MAGKTQTQIYKLDLDASNLISSYRSAISQMQKAGTKASITEGMIKELDKLETKFQELSDTGAFGVEGSKGIVSFNRKSQELYKSLASLGREMERIAKDSSNLDGANLKGFQKTLNELDKKAKTVFKGVTDQLKQIGLKDSSLGIGTVIKTEDQLVDKLQEELEKRQQIVEQREKELETARKLAKETAAGKSTEALLKGATARPATMGFKEDGAAKKDALVKQVQSTVTSGLQNSLSVTDIMAQINQSLEAAGTTSDKFFKNVTDFEAKLATALEQVNNAYNSNEGDIAKLQQALDESVVNRNKLGDENGAFSPAATASVQEFSNSLQNLSQINAQAAATEQQLRDREEEAAQAQHDLLGSTQSLIPATESEAQAQREQVNALRDSAAQTETATRELDNFRMSMVSLLSVTTIFNSIRNAIRKTFEDIKTLDKSFASIAMVTSNSVEGMWSSYNHYASMAQELGQSTDSVIKASALFYQQGLEEAEALELTANTMKLATLAGNDYETATQEMTAAIRGFKMEMEEGAHVTDVYSTLAANAAASVDDIAQAMSRTASIANSAGMSFENTAAFLTQVIETTQESAENIGTSLKTIIARFTELKTNVAGTADSEFDDLDFNKVDTALKSVGVSLKDAEGQFRDLDEVFLELSKKWDTLDRNTQRYVATIAAGSRQQSRFIAMMDNYERTAELMDVAAKSEGKADEQFAKYADTMEYKLNQLATKWEEFRVNFLNSDFFKGVLDVANELMDRLSNINLHDSLDVSSLLIMIPLVIKSIKDIGTSVFDTIGNSKKAFSDLATNIKKNLPKAIASNKYPLPIEPEIDKTEVDHLKQQVAQAKAKLEQDKANHIKLSIGIDTSKKLGNAELQQLKNHVKELREQGALTKEEFDRMWAAMSNDRQGVKAPQKIREVTAELERMELQAQNAFSTQESQIGRVEAQLEGAERELESYNQALDRYNLGQERAARNQSILNGVMTVGSMALQSAMIPLTGLISGTMSGTEALKAFVAQMAIQTVSLAANTLAKKVNAAVEKANAESTVANNATIAASNEAVAASWWSVFAAEMAALWPIMLIVAAIAAAVAVIVLITAATKKWLKQTDEQTKAQKRLSDATEELQRLKAAANEANNNANSLEKEVESAKKLKEEYERLSALQKTRGLSDEEQQRLDEIKKEIRETMPEIVSAYNAETNELQVQVDLWEKKLQLQEDYVKQAQFGAGIASSAVLVQQLDVNQKEADLQTLQLKAMDEDDFGKVWSDWDSGELIDFYSYVQQYIDNIEEDMIDYGDGRHEFISASPWAALDRLETNGVDVTKLAKQFGYEDILEQSADVQYEFLKRLTNEADEGYAEYFNVLQDVTDDLDEKNRAANQELITLRGANIAEYADTNEIVGRIIAGTGVVSNYQTNVKDLAKSDLVNTGKDGWDDNKVKSYNSLSKDTQQIILAAGYTEESWNELDVSSEKANKEMLDRINAAKDEYYLQLYGVEFLEKLTDETTKAMTAYGEDARTLTQEELKQRRENLEELYRNNTALSEEEKNELIASTQLQHDQFIDNLNSQKDALRLVLGQSQYSSSIGQNTEGKIYLGNWDTETLETVNQLIGEIGEKYDKVAASDYAAQVFAIPDLSPEDIQKALSFDWSQYRLGSEDEVKESFMETFSSLGEEGAERLFGRLKSYAKHDGIIELSIDTEEAYTEFVEQIDDLKDKVQKIGDGFVDVAKDIADGGAVTFSTFEKMAESLKELGLSAYDYFSIDANGQISTDEEKLKQLYEDQLKAQQSKLKQQLTENKAKEAELNVTLANLDATYKAVEAAADGEEVIYNDVKATHEGAVQAKAWADQFDRIRGTNTSIGEIAQYTFQVSNDTDRQEYLAAIEQSKLAIQTQLEQIQGINENLEKEIANGDAWTAAALRDYNQRVAEARGETLDVEEATKKYKDALKDLADAQEDVADKQADLNEKLAEYNELLYGSENRKSSLDFLYNYDEALKSFNDEIGRAKELLDDSTNVKEATDALTRYANATHSLIAEETAKQQIIKAGLSNYAASIENGSYSYTNKETGERTNINFGDYAKKDSRTGKYVIDQRLINEARFSDQIKDLLEEQVSTYNEYSEKLLESEDNVRKAEKEIQDLRLEALKNYANMETELAEALKDAYEQEVNNLKDKYDSMKDADDDYIDALQDAIEKQRKLREQENKYEDLAKKEKKLSLMQRDTSGSNELSVRKLEDEVQKDRQTLLDEAIDNVIDSLQELYESQQELRDEEVELKEALIDNTAFWNMKAEEMAGSFESAEEYASYLSGLSEEYAMMTLVQQQVKLAEYGETYTAASQYMAMQAMDSASETGDFIIDTTTITGEEVSEIITDTSETFTTEVTRALDETTAAFEADMLKAEQSINDAKRALQEAINKLAECSAAANAAAEAMRNAQAYQDSLNSAPPAVTNNSDTLYSRLVDAGVNHNALDDISHKLNGDQETAAMLRTLGVGKSGTVFKFESEEEAMKIAKFMKENGNDRFIGRVGDEYRVFAKESDRNNWVNSNAESMKGNVKKYLSGGLVDYTGPAWVDGTPERPESFLNAEDTARIGSAAKILSDIPLLADPDRAERIVNNSVGDTNIEIHMNIDHIDSDVDLEEVVERVKDEVVAVARPAGTNVILNQHV